MVSLSSNSSLKNNFKKLKGDIVSKAKEIKKISLKTNETTEPAEFTDAVTIPTVLAEPIQQAGHTEHTEINYIVVNPPIQPAPVPVKNNSGAKFQLNWVFPLVSAIILGGFAALRDFKDKKKIIRYTLFGGFLGSVLGLRIEHENKYISVFKYITILAFPPIKETTNQLGYTPILGLDSHVDTTADHIVMDNSPEVNAEELTKLIESQQLDYSGLMTPTADVDAPVQEPTSFHDGENISPVNNGDLEEIPFEKEPVEESPLEEMPTEKEPVEKEDVSSGPISLIEEDDDFIDEPVTTPHDEPVLSNTGDVSTGSSTATGNGRPLKDFNIRPGGVRLKKVRAGNNKKKKNKRKK